MYIYEKHTGFRVFTEKMTKLRQKSKLRGNGARDEFYKLVLNRSHRYDIMNEEKIFHIKKCKILVFEFYI
jgi:hypothetical protein